MMTYDDVIVSFDVSGKIHRVRKSLLRRYPSTMLCTVADDINTRNTEIPIFVDSNGDRFQYVIEYMRNHEKIIFLATVCKESLLKG
jgi:BTB/POZ domain